MAPFSSTWSWENPPKRNVVKRGEGSHTSRRRTTDKERGEQSLSAHAKKRQLLLAHTVIRAGTEHAVSLPRRT